MSIIQQIEAMENDSIVKVTVIPLHPYGQKGIVEGRVHRGITTCGNPYFYISPLGDPHAGACITKSEIRSIH